MIIVYENMLKTIGSVYMYSSHDCVCVVDIPRIIVFEHTIFPLQLSNVVIQPSIWIGKKKIITF
jgi:hypothetical protein